MYGEFVERTGVYVSIDEFNTILLRFIIIAM